MVQSLPRLRWADLESQFGKTSNYVRTWWIIWQTQKREVQGGTLDRCCMGSCGSKKFMLWRLRAVQPVSPGRLMRLRQRLPRRVVFLRECVWILRGLPRTEGDHQASMFGKRSGFLLWNSGQTYSFKSICKFQTHLHKITTQNHAFCMWQCVKDLASWLVKERPPNFWELASKQNCWIHHLHWGVGLAMLVDLGRLADDCQASK